MRTKHRICGLFFLAMITGIWIALAITFATALSSVAGRFSETLVPSSVASCVMILRIFTEGVAILLSIMVGLTLDMVFWHSISKSVDVAIPTLLGISTATGIFGLLELLFWRIPSNRSCLSVHGHHFWVICRSDESLN